ncbi:uncharacterized protein V6R79_020534 [Siganus canaliculatus]
MLRQVASPPPRQQQQVAASVCQEAAGGGGGGGVSLILCLQKSPGSIETLRRPRMKSPDEAPDPQLLGAFFKKHDDGTTKIQRCLIFVITKKPKLFSQILFSSPERSGTENVETRRRRFKATTFSAPTFNKTQLV